MSRLLGYLWALPVTLLGFVIAGIGWCRLLDLDKDGVFHFAAKPGGLAALFFKHFASAFCWGAVIVYEQPGLRNLRWLVNHEKHHFHQCRRWGVFIIPAYVACFLFLLVAGKKPYHDNPFEVSARAVEGDRNVLVDSTGAT